MKSGKRATTTHYLSFAGDDGWRGAVYIKADTFFLAVLESHALGINPGGEVMGLEIPPDMVPPEEYYNRLVTKKDLREIDKFHGGRGEAVRAVDGVVV